MMQYDEHTIARFHGDYPDEEAPRPIMPPPDRCIMAQYLLSHGFWSDDERPTLRWILDSLSRLGYESSLEQVDVIVTEWDRGNQELAAELLDAAALTWERQHVRGLGDLIQAARARDVLPLPLVQK